MSSQLNPGDRTTLPRSIFIALVIAGLSLGLRLPGLGDFMTADEANWMDRGRSFYKDTFIGNLGGTFMSTHPGATAMWLIGGGIVAQESRLGFSFEPDTLIHFKKAATLPMLVFISLLLGLCAWLLIPLMGEGAALLAGLFLAADPYLIGSSQLVHLDALQATLMLAALLSFLLFLRAQARPAHTPYRIKPTAFIVLVGILTGLACGNRLMMALWLVPVYGVLLIIHYRHTLRANWTHVGNKLGLIVGIGALVFYALWPVLWVKDDVSRSFVRDVRTSFTDEHVALAVSDEPINPTSFYLRTWAARTTPLTQGLLVGAVLLAGFALLRRKPMAHLRLDTYTILALLGYAIGFMVIISLAAKKADRYALPPLIAFPAIAGWLLWRVLTLVRNKKYRHRYFQYALLGVVVIAVIWVPLRWSPYAIAYNNPYFDVRPLSQQGWGEGLEAAAQWLNQQPLADKVIVASWYKTVLAPYFKGKTMTLSSRDDYRVSYVVTYRNMESRAEDTIASDVLDEFKGKQPVYVASIMGKPYAWVYDTGTVGRFYRHVGELLPAMEVGQTVTPPATVWDSIDIGFATFESRANFSDIIFHVRENMDSTDDIRTVRVNTRELKDNKWHTFLFAPIISDSSRSYYIAVTADNATPGNAVTVRYVDRDILPGEFSFRTRSLAGNERMSDYIKPGDIAYRFSQ